MKEYILPILVFVFVAWSWYDVGHRIGYSRGVRDEHNKKDKNNGVS